MNKPIIGIVGGVGPYAGADLLRKIFDHTEAEVDQAHLSVALLSYPGEVADRTAFLLGDSQVNPAEALLNIIVDLARLGSVGIGIPCNSAHAPAIFDIIINTIKASGLKIDLVNMVRETVDFIQTEFADVSKVGVLATAGTAKVGTYSTALIEANLWPILPDEIAQHEIHETIYSIKKQSNPPREQDRRKALDAVAQLAGEGAEAVILGCTELPLVISEKRIGDTWIIDPTTVLARALVRRADPEKLKPWTVGQRDKFIAT